MEPQEKRTGPEQPNIAPLRTFKSDVEDAIKQGASATTIAMAEQKKRADEGRAAKPPLAPFYKIAIAVSGVLILCGLVLLSVYFFAPKKKPAPTLVLPAKLITTNTEKEISVDGLDRAKFLKALEAFKNGSPVQAAAIEAIDLVSEQSGYKQVIGADRFFGLLELSPSSAFLRSLGSNFMFGYHGFTGNQPFLILKTDSYDAAFAGMLAWEKNMYDQIGPVFSTSLTQTASQPSASTTLVTLVSTNGLKTVVATSTATNTPPALVAPPVWSDMVLYNKDTRVLKNGAGAILLIYSFVDPHTLVITNNQTTFREILSRLYAAALIR